MTKQDTKIPKKLQTVPSHVTMMREENKDNDAPEESQIWTQILWYIYKLLTSTICSEHI